MNRIVRTLASVVRSVILLGASAPLASAQTGEVPLQSRWSNQLMGGGASTWTFTPQGGGRYDAREVGMANARGTAVRTGNHLHIDFTTAVAAGYYDVDLNAAGTDGTGQVVLTQGALAGNAYRTAFRGMDPRVTFRGAAAESLVSKAVGRGRRPPGGVPAPPRRGRPACRDCPARGPSHRLPAVHGAGAGTVAGAARRNHPAQRASRRFPAGGGAGAVAGPPE